MWDTGPLNPLGLASLSDMTVFVERSFGWEFPFHRQVHPTGHETLRSPALPDRRPSRSCCSTASSRSASTSPCSGPRCSSARRSERRRSAHGFGTWGLIRAVPRSPDSRFRSSCAARRWCSFSRLLSSPQGLRPRLQSPVRRAGQARGDECLLPRVCVEHELVRPLRFRTALTG